MSLNVDDAVERLKAEGSDALGDVFEGYSERLERMVSFRMDRRLAGRVEPADILQEAYIEIARRLDGFLAKPEVSFFVWARQITWQIVIAVQRRHFGEKRTPKREVRWQAQNSQATFSIARQLVGQMTSPSRVAIREEQVVQLREALSTMDPVDREVLALRHFEQLSNTEVAETLELSTTAASNRYVRALTRLGEILSTMEGFQQ